MTNKEIFSRVTRFFAGDEVPAKMIKRAFNLSLAATKKERTALASGSRDEFAAAVATVSGCKPIDVWVKSLPYGLIREVQKAGAKIAPQTHFSLSDAPEPNESPIAAAFAAAAKK